MFGFNAPVGLAEFHLFDAKPLNDVGNGADWDSSVADCQSGEHTSETSTGWWDTHVIPMVLGKMYTRPQGLTGVFYMLLTAMTFLHLESPLPLTL